MERYDWLHKSNAIGSSWRDRRSSLVDEDDVLKDAFICLNILPGLGSGSYQVTPTRRSRCSYSSRIGRGQIFENARRTMPEVVWISATLATPSLPGKTSTIRPKPHFSGGWLSSFIRTSVFFFRQSWFSLHLPLVCSSETYSLDQRLQKCWRICSTLW